MVSCNVVQGLAGVSWILGNFSCESKLYFVVSPEMLSLLSISCISNIVLRSLFIFPV